MHSPSVSREQFLLKPASGGNFVVGFRKVTPIFDARQFAAEAAHAAGVERAECVVGRELAVTVAACGAATVATSAGGRRIALLFGELHGQTAVTATGLAAAEPEPSADLVVGLDGSWAIIRFDADRDTAVVVTDRLNSRRILYGCDGNTHWLTSSLDQHPLRGGRVDPVAVGWYLTHGAIYGNRTLYDAIRVLPPSTLHHVAGSGVSMLRYWTPTFSSAGIVGDSERILQSEFGDLLVDAVRCRVQGAEPLWVSLSAGYDAAGIAGILGERIRQSGVNCFSYARGTASKDSDESISAETAKRLGYHHDVLESYGGDYPSWLDANARASRAMAGLCDEVDAWATLASKTAGGNAAIFVGDECLGWTDYALKCPADALRAAQIEGNSHLATARAVLSFSAFKKALDGIESDIHEMLASAPPFDDLHDLKDYFYITQRAPNYILPWRQNFAGRVGSVRFPLLDCRVLDFMAQVPAALRRQKALYRRTISQLCPKTFSLPRATSASYHVDHATEFAGAGSSLLPLRSQAISEIVAPALQAAVSAASHSGSHAPGRGSFYKFVVKAIKHTAIGDLLRKAQPAPPVRQPSPAELLTRLFCLDRAIACDSPS